MTRPCSASRWVPTTMSVVPAASSATTPLLVPLRHEAAEHLDLDREGGEAAPEGEQVLLGEDGGGDQDRNLAAGLHDPEGGPQRDLGLAVPHVPGHQAVHRSAAGHVAGDLSDRPLLVRRLGERERLLQLPLPGRVLGVGEPVCLLARRVQLQQVVGEVQHRLPHAALGVGPFATAELREAGRRSAGVTRDAAHLVGGQEDLVVAREVQLEVFTDLIAQGALGHADIAGDPVIDVDYQLPGLQLTEQVAGDDPLGSEQAPQAGGAEQLAVRDQDQVRGPMDEAGAGRAVDEGNAPGRWRLLQGVGRTDAAGHVSEQLRQPAALVGGDDDTRRTRRELAEPLPDLVGAAGKCRRGRVHRAPLGALLQALGCAVEQGGQCVRSHVRRLPVGRQFPACHQLRSPVGRPAVRLPRRGRGADRRRSGPGGCRPAGGPPSAPAVRWPIQVSAASPMSPASSRARSVWSVSLSSPRSPTWAMSASRRSSAPGTANSPAGGAGSPSGVTGWPGWWDRTPEWRPPRRRTARSGWGPARRAATGR